jgi:hypothetical protein
LLVKRPDGLNYLESWTEAFEIKPAAFTGVTITRSNKDASEEMMLTVEFTTVNLIPKSEATTKFSDLVGFIDVIFELSSTA